MKQGILITGTLAFIKHNESKKYDDKIIPESQTLQISIMTPDGFSVVDIKDTDFLVKKDMIGKPITVSVQISSFNNNTYYKLLEVI